MNRANGNTLVITLLGLAVAAIVGLCFAPLQLRTCGHRSSLVDRWFPHWNYHACNAATSEVTGNLWGMPQVIKNYRQKNGHLGDSLLEMIPPRSRYLGLDKLAYRKDGSDWQISVTRTPDLPGWYLLTSDGKLHFNERGPATAQDPPLWDLRLHSSP